MRARVLLTVSALVAFPALRMRAQSVPGAVPASPQAAVPVGVPAGAPIVVTAAASASGPSALGLTLVGHADPLPDAPVPANSAVRPVPTPCRTDPGTAPEAESSAHDNCVQANPYARFLDSNVVVALTVRQKGRLALHNYFDPGNLVTIAGTSAFSVATNPYSAFGPGLKGFGRSTGYTLLQDATGEFFGTFAIPSLTHEDPHYHRMPHASIPHRVLHAISRTVIAQSDYGTNMPNYATLLTYPICAELSNLYVPGVHGNGPSTAARIMTGLATDPADNLITEFLPDLARHIHVRIIFVQRLLNNVATDQYLLQ
jgi:hypothetical protein